MEKFFTKEDSERLEAAKECHEAFIGGNNQAFKEMFVELTSEDANELLAWNSHNMEVFSVTLPDAISSTAAPRTECLASNSSLFP